MMPAAAATSQAAGAARGGCSVIRFGSRSHHSAAAVPPPRRVDPFYEALGFERTYRQERPNPYAVVARQDINIHLFGIDGFAPEVSYGSVILLVPTPDGLYRAFAAGLRAAYVKLPAAGIPLILRPRKRHGTVYGFTTVDPGPRAGRGPTPSSRTRPIPTART